MYGHPYDLWVPLQRMEHVGIVVDDLDAAVDFFVALGLEPTGDGSVEGEWVERIIGIDDPEVDFAMLTAPDGSGGIELVRFKSPPSPAGDPEMPANVPGLRHLAFSVDDLDAVLADLEPHGAELVGEVVRYGDVYRLCYVRGPAGIIVELAEPL